MQQFNFEGFFGCILNYVVYTFGVYRFNSHATCVKVMKFHLGVDLIHGRIIEVQGFLHDVSQFDFCDNIFFLIFLVQLLFPD